MIVTVAVHGSPYGSMSNQHALAFCRACYASGHSVSRVFFYHDGVYAGLGSRTVPQDEANVTAQWQDFARQHNLELCVCIANALKRGVVDEAEARRYDHPAASIADGFNLVGLGQLIDAIAGSDRYVEFPA